MHLPPGNIGLREITRPIQGVPFLGRFWPLSHEAVLWESFEGEEPIVEFIDMRGVWRRIRHPIIDFSNSDCEEYAIARGLRLLPMEKFIGNLPFRLGRKYILSASEFERRLRSELEEEKSYFPLIRDCTTTSDKLTKGQPEYEQAGKIIIGLLVAGIGLIAIRP